MYADVAPAQATPHQTFFGSAPGSTLVQALEGKRTHALSPLMHKLRIVKTGEEAAIMRKAGKFSGRAFTAAMAQQFGTEKELGSFLEYQFLKNGCDGSAYVPVIAGGEVGPAQLRMRGLR